MSTQPGPVIDSYSVDFRDAIIGTPSISLNPGDDKQYEYIERMSNPELNPGHDDVFYALGRIMMKCMDENRD